MNAARDGTPVLEIHSRAWPALAWTHLTVHGALYLQTRTQLLDAVVAALEPGHRITLDLSEVTAVDYAGARAIRECEALADEQHADLMVEDPSPAVRHGLKALS